MAPRLVRQLGLKDEPASTSTQGLNSHVMVSAHESQGTSIVVQYFEHLAPVNKPEVQIVPMKAYDLGLGLPWFRARNPEIDRSRWQLTALNSPGGDGAIPEADPIGTLHSGDNISDAKLLSEQCGDDRPPSSPDIQILGATAFDHLLAGDEVAETVFLRLGDCTGMFGVTGERSHEQGEYACTLDVRAGAAVVVPVQEIHIDGAWMTATGSPSHEWNTGTAGLSPIVANRSNPGSRDPYPSPPISSCCRRWLIVCKQDGTEQTKTGMLPTEGGGRTPA